MRLWRAVLTYFLAGCTTSLSVNDASKDGAQFGPETAEGLLYYLSATAFSLDVAFEILECRDDVGLTLPERLTYAVTPVVTTSTLPDRSQAFIITYPALNAFTKVTTTKFTLFENGTLSSVNAAIDDRTGALISSVFDAGTKVVRAVALGGASFDTFADAKPESVCSDEMSRLVSAKKVAEDALALQKALEKQKEGAQEAVTNAMQGLAKSRASYRLAADGSPSEAQAAKEEEARALALYELSVDAFKSLQSQVDVEKAQAAVARAKEALKFKVTATWVPGGETPISMKLPVPERQLSKFFTEPAWKAYRDSCGEGQAEVAGCMANIMGVEVRLISGRTQENVDASRKLAPVEASAPTRSTGLVYRQPGPGRLLVCRQACAETDFGTPNYSDLTLVDRMYSISQFGTVAALPLTNKAFDNNTLEVAFSQVGSVTQLNFTTKAKSDAVSETISKSSESLLSAVQTGINEQRTERAAQRTERTTALESSLKLREMEREEAANAREADIDAADDRAKLLDKYQEIERRRAGTVPGQANALRDLENQSALLEAQLKVERLRTEIQLEVEKRQPTE